MKGLFAFEAEPFEFEAYGGFCPMKETRGFEPLGGTFKALR